MGGTFNPVFLADKLARLNSSQQSIETLSHWCIFHMNKSPQVVETWDRQFHSSSREQRLSFLYLANDILQNSRRKGTEFVTEFWRVLPDAIRDVIEKGDEASRNAAFRLISIWEERKVFGSRGQILKEEFTKKQLDNVNRNLKHAEPKLKSPDGSIAEKLISSYEAVDSCQREEEIIINKCRSAISFVDKVDENFGGNSRLVGNVNSSITDELQGQTALLMESIEKLKVVESSRENLLSLLRKAIREQEDKMDTLRVQLQAAHTGSKRAVRVYSKIVGENGVSSSATEKSVQIEEETAKLSSSKSISISEGITKESSSNDHPILPSQKRAKIDNDHHQPYVPNPQNLQPTTFSQPQQYYMPIVSMELRTNSSPPPPPPSSPPPMPPLPPPIQMYPVPEYMQTAMQIPNGQYNYSTYGVSLSAAFVPTISNDYQSYTTTEAAAGYFIQTPQMDNMGRE